MSEDPTPRRGRRWLMLALLGLVVVLVPVACVKTLDGRARTTLSRFVAQSQPELAFVGGVLSGLCVVADAVEASQSLAPVTQAIEASASKPPKAERVEGLLKVYASTVKIAVRTSPAPPGDPASTARDESVALTNRLLPIITALPVFDERSRAAKTSLMNLAQDWKQIVVRPAYEPADLRQLDEDLRRVAEDNGKVFEATFDARLKEGRDLAILQVYLIAMASRLPLISTLASSLVSSLLSSAKLDEALRAAPSFESARTSGCLSEKPALADAIIAFESRELGPDFLQKLTRDDHHD